MTQLSQCSISLWSDKKSALTETHKDVEIAKTSNDVISSGSQFQLVQDTTTDALFMRSDFPEKNINVDIGDKTSFLPR